MKNITRVYNMVNRENIDEFLEKVNEEKQESCSCCESFDYSNPKRYCRTRSYSYYDDCVYGDYDYYDDSDDISAGQNYSRKLRGYRRREAQDKFRGQRTVILEMFITVIQSIWLGNLKRKKRKQTSTRSSGAMMITSMRSTQKKLRQKHRLKPKHTKRLTCVSSKRSEIKPC